MHPASTGVYKSLIPTKGRYLHRGASSLVEDFSLMAEVVLLQIAQTLLRIREKGEEEEEEDLDFQNIFF